MHTGHLIDTDAMRLGFVTGHDDLGVRDSQSVHRLAKMMQINTAVLTYLGLVGNAGTFTATTLASTASA